MKNSYPKLVSLEPLFRIVEELKYHLPKVCIKGQGFVRVNTKRLLEIGCWNWFRASVKPIEILGPTNKLITLMKKDSYRDACIISNSNCSVRLKVGLHSVLMFLKGFNKCMQCAPLPSIGLSIVRDAGCAIKGLFSISSCLATDVITAGSVVGIKLSS